MAHALATSALAPSSDTGVVRNVLDHHTLNTQAGLSVRLDVDDICRLCWLWEWDGKSLSAKGKEKGKDEGEKGEEGEGEEGHLGRLGGTGTGTCLRAVARDVAEKRKSQSRCGAEQWVVKTYPSEPQL